MIDVKIPNGQKVLYIPGSLETIKFAWIQYLSLVIPSLYIFYALCGFIFRHQIIETSVTSDLLVKRKI